MTEIKICPLRDPTIEVEYTQCIDNECAWWVNYEEGGGYCAIKTIPFELRKLSDMLARIVDRLPGEIP